MISFDDIENAFYYVSADQPFTNYAIINRNTGEVYFKSEFTGEDEFPEDYESDDYIGIPHKNDLDLGRDLVFDFTANYLPDRFEDVGAMFRSKGAYRRFKSLLESLGLLQKWYKFEDEKTKLRLRQWCEDNGLEISG